MAWGFEKGGLGKLGILFDVGTLNLLQT